jgi:hypothetical protein
VQVVALEQEAAELRAAARRSASARLPGAGDVLTSLGLDGWKDARLRPKVRLCRVVELTVPSVIHVSRSYDMCFVTLHVAVHQRLYQCGPHTVLQVKIDEDVETGNARPASAGGGDSGLMAAASAKRREVVSQVCEPSLLAVLSPDCQPERPVRRTRQNRQRPGENALQADRRKRGNAVLHVHTKQLASPE